MTFGNKGKPSSTSIHKEDTACNTNNVCVKIQISYHSIRHLRLSCIKDDSWGDISEYGRWGWNQEEKQNKDKANTGKHNEKEDSHWSYS